MPSSKTPTHCWSHDCSFEAVLCCAVLCCAVLWRWAQFKSPTYPQVLSNSPCSFALASNSAFLFLHVCLGLVKGLRSFPVLFVENLFSHSFYSFPVRLFLKDLPYRLVFRLQFVVDLGVTLPFRQFFSVPSFLSPSVVSRLLLLTFLAQPWFSDFFEG